MHISGTLQKLCRPAYDVSLDDFEKGMTSARLDEIFAQASKQARKPASQLARWLASKQEAEHRVNRI